MYQVHAALNLLVYDHSLCAFPYCSYSVTISNGTSSPNDDGESSSKGGCLSRIAKQLYSQYDEPMNICRTVSPYFFTEIVVWQER
jgi:hypothetical protein